MPSFRVLSPVLTFTLIALMTSGCVNVKTGGTSPEGMPAPVETTPPPSEPVSDEDALADAMAILDPYDESWSQLWSDSSADVAVLKPFVTADRFESEVVSVQNMRRKGGHLEGQASRLNEQIIDRDKTEVTSVLICYDLSEIRYFDDTGADVTPAGRDMVMPVLVGFTRSDGKLLISHRKDWKGSDPCRE